MKNENLKREEVLNFFKTSFAKCVFCNNYYSLIFNVFSCPSEVRTLTMPIPL